MGILPLPNPDALQDDEGWASTGLYRFLSSVEKEARGTATSLTNINTSITNANTAISNLQTLSTQKLTAGTPKTFTTATTFWDFTGIPSWAKKITFVASNLTVSGASLSVGTILQLGTSAGIENTGYSSAGLYFAFNATVGTAPASGAGMLIAMAGSGSITAILNNVTGNTWVVSGSSYVIGSPSTYACTYYSSKTLAGPLTTVRLTNSAGTANITAGTANIFYE